MISEIDSTGLQEKMNAGDDIHLVDIRTPAEVAQAAIPQALHLPMHLLPLRMNELPKDKEVVLYCRSGARSYHACHYLTQQGFDKVINLRGGIISWARQGYEIAQGISQ